MDELRSAHLCLARDSRIRAAGHSGIQDVDDGNGRRGADGACVRLSAVHGHAALQHAFKA